MFRSFFVFITILILISACTPAPQATPQPDQPTTTSSPLPTTTPTRTALPSATPTASITPLPTIPTFTPTYDVSTIVTVTPAPKAECPKTISVDKPNLDFLIPDSGLPRYPKATENNLIEFLNKYDPIPLVNAVENKWGNLLKNTAFQDLTNDGEQEVILGIENFYIFGCESGHYKTLLRLEPNQYAGPALILSIEDNNRNGIPEITLLINGDSHGGTYYQIYEWNGTKFSNLIPSKYPDIPDGGEIGISASGKIHFEDIDKDSIKELIVDSGIPTSVGDVYYVGFPWRDERSYYKWNGQQYGLMKKEFSQLEFRFQAVQDGDTASSQEEYKKALSLYQEAIFSDKLKSYSPEIRDNLRTQWDTRYGTAPTPTPYPNDLTEYPRLAAYAYYRIMLIHLVQGYESDASTVYNTLQEKFSNDPYGQPYAEMATAFWEAYQSTHKMYDGCAAAIEYAVEHPDILIPLGSDYHGWQSHIYKPEDVCPFR